MNSAENCEPITFENKPLIWWHLAHCIKARYERTFNAYKYLQSQQIALKNQFQNYKCAHTENWLLFTESKRTRAREIKQTLNTFWVYQQLLFAIECESALRYTTYIICASMHILIALCVCHSCQWCTIILFCKRKKKKELNTHWCYTRMFRVRHFILLYYKINDIPSFVSYVFSSSSLEIYFSIQFGNCKWIYIHYAYRVKTKIEREE